MAHFTPRPYQHLIRNFIFDNQRGNVFASPGMGKTSSTIEAFAELKTFGEVNRLLVFAPKRVAVNSWPDEVQKFRESFSHLSIAAAVGTADERLAALRRTPDILTINYDNIGWLMDQYGDHWPFDMVVADESTRLKGLRVSLQQRKKKDGTLGAVFIAGTGTKTEGAKGTGSKRSRQLATVAHTKVRRWGNLTGSPAPNGLQDLWGQQWYVDAGKRLMTSYDAFKRRWFAPEWGSSREQERIRPLAHAQPEIQRLLAQTSITVDARDWFDISEPIERHIFVDLPPQARKQYDEMQKDLFTWIQEHPLEAFSAGTRSLKCLQMASGSVIIDRDGNWLPVHDEKIEALQSIVAETTGENLLVAYQYKADVERILKAFPQARKLDSKPQTLRDFQDGKIPLLLVHPKSAGHGLDMQQNCHILVDYSSGFNLEEDEQVIERIGPTRQAQMGRKIDVWRYRIVARNTVEETAVLPALQYKMSVQEAFKHAIKTSR